VLKKLLPETNPIVLASKQQFDMYFKLSVQHERQKSVITRAMGSNKQKIDPKFMRAVAEHRQKEKFVAAAEQAFATQQEEEPEHPEVQEQRRQSAVAQMRYDNLVGKLTGPNSKRDFLDVLEYQHMREKQAEFERVYK